MSMPVLYRYKKYQLESVHVYQVYNIVPKQRSGIPTLSIHYHIDNCAKSLMENEKKKFTKFKISFYSYTVGFLLHLHRYGMTSVCSVKYPARIAARKGLPR